MALGRGTARPSWRVAIARCRFGPAKEFSTGCRASRGSRSWGRGLSRPALGGITAALPARAARAPAPRRRGPCRRSAPPRPGPAARRRRPRGRAPARAGARGRPGRRARRRRRGARCWGRSGQVAPGDAGAAAVEHRLDEQPVALGRDPDPPRAAGRQAPIRSRRSSRGAWRRTGRSSSPAGLQVSPLDALVQEALQKTSWAIGGRPVAAALLRALGLSVQQVGYLTPAQVGEPHMPERRQHVGPQAQLLFLTGAQGAGVPLDVGLDEFGHRLARGPVISGSLPLLELGLSHAYGNPGLAQAHSGMGIQREALLTARETETLDPSFGAVRRHPQRQPRCFSDLVPLRLDLRLPHNASVSRFPPPAISARPFPGSHLHRVGGERRRTPEIATYRFSSIFSSVPNTPVHS